jgi:hypothetical protein
VAKRVAALCQVELPDPLGRLDELCCFDAALFQKQGAVEDYKRELLGRGEMDPPHRIETGRHLVAGSLAAWATLAASEVEGDALRQAASRLAERTLAALAACAPEGDRAGEDDLDTTGAARDLANALLVLTEEAPA